MKLHKASIEKLIRTYSMWGGRSSDDKLIQAIAELDFDVYEQKNGKKVLVPSDVMENEKAAIAQKTRSFIR